MSELQQRTERISTGPPTRKGADGKEKWTFEPYQDETGRWICGARTRKGRPCKHDSVKPGGRCRGHGGEARNVYQRRLKHGRYSKFLTDTIKDKYEQFLHDEDLLDLRDEIAMLRARIAEQPDLPLKSLLATTEVIGRLVDKMIAREASQKFFIHVSRLQILQANLVHTIVKTLDVCPHCLKPLDSLREELASAISAIPLLEAGDESKAA